MLGLCLFSFNCMKNDTQFRNMWKQILNPACISNSSYNFCTWFQGNYMPHITTLIKPSGKLSSLLPMRRSATWFLARASRQSSGPAFCLSSPPWLGRAARECLQRSGPQVHSGGKWGLEDLLLSCICKKRHAVITRLYVYLGLDWWRTQCGD